ncbi:fused MFS/spermidine synthase [Piscinibacter sp. HJYY11]|uniref:fused MFS/spermidine synthase n=1 Tax=Piscinibacter sp. HJYY11 TaxID=2801333 RepID=UPI001F3C9453|nr:fused MFS/spermidine synthase [Piscinibacter sp. HJYY11]
MLMIASGFAALGYQIVWTQQATVWLGHESSAVLAVVGSFFAGLALGAVALGRRAETSTHPGRWYAVCEAVIGIWGLALVWAMPQAGRALMLITGDDPSAAWQAAVAFGGTLVLLLPATAAMGATLPALERALARGARRGDSLALLYAGNTLGAVLGVLAAAFWLVPTHGLSATAALCAALNLLCAVAAPWLLGRDAPRAASDAAATPSRQPLVLLAATGLLGIGYEVLVVRVLRQVSENTVYTFAMLLAVYLVGTAWGAAAYQRWRVGRPDATQTTGVLLMALAITALCGTASLWAAGTLKSALLATTGAGMAAAIAAEAVLAAAAFGVPTVVMGALFSHLATQAVAQGQGFGRALAVNTLGAAMAPLVFGVVLAPAVGHKLALLVVVVGYVLLALRVMRPAGPVGIAVAAGVLALVTPPLAFIDIPEGGRIISHRDGTLGAVSVVEDAHGVARLHIDNRQQEGSSATAYADARQALVPVLLHPAPRQALFLGLGTGVTARAAALDAQLHVQVVELVPEVIDASALFADVLGHDTSARLQVIAGDARRHVGTTGQRYDVIVSDNFHPARSGSASLYTVEHFRAVRARLAPGGLFCQWLPLHQLDLPTLRSIVAAFVEAEPEGLAVLATLSLDTPVVGLISRPGSGPIDIATVGERLRSAALPEPSAAWGLRDEVALLGSVIAGPKALARLSAGAEPNRDDRPVVAYRAPRVTYSPDSHPRDRLLALLGELQVHPAEVLSADAATSTRLVAYWQARDRFLAAGRDVQPTRDVQRMLAQVREPLLEVLRISPEFSPAAEPLRHMAAALARLDAPAARALEDEIARLQGTGR